MEENDPASYGREPTERQKPHGAAPPDHASYPGNSRDKKHQAYERAYWIITGAASIVATIAAGVAAWYAVGAYEAGLQSLKAADEQIRISRQSLISAERPWIRSRDLIEPLQLSIAVTENGVGLSAGINVKNIGKSPAERVFAQAKLFLPSQKLNGKAEARTLCEQATKNEYAGMESLIFPDQEGTVYINATMFLSDQDKNLISEIYGSSGFPITLIGCITYLIPIGAAIGQTVFVYSVNRRCGSKPTDVCGFQMNKAGTFLGREIVLFRTTSEEFAR